MINNVFFSRVNQTRPYLNNNKVEIKSFTVTNIFHNTRECGTMFEKLAFDAVELIK